LIILRFGMIYRKHFKTWIMKIIYKISFIACIGAALFSCSKSKVNPVKSSHVDTSKTLVADKRLVGNWAIVTDTISINGSGIMYHGSAGDYYKFTNYGNLYIAESLQNLVDTAIYTISSISNQVGWTNLYTRVNGVTTTLATTNGPLTIVTLDTANLVLTQNAQNSNGTQYEKITFKKMK
jgi:hypothetical protein